ncbi:torsin-1A-interacting protein 1-like isoform X2 [Hyla sarda]|uniref:torsin-1A-interacting protein 1-like isoform X2 n=1 Tax=Hyla sarda TaxID=327740 RepID=UPI0024C23D01|nr:torsin-1A-interacting protein 1-like isoform X2 [Hyla sarda]
MISRRKGGNTGNSTAVEKKRYELRGRTINSGEQSFHSPSVYTITNPQTPEPDNISDIVIPLIKSAAKEKDRTLVKSKSTRRTTRPVTPEMDDNSDGSDYDNSSTSGVSENDRQPNLPTTASSFTNDTTLNLVRPPISSASRMQPPVYTRDKLKEETYTEERLTLRSKKLTDKPSVWTGTHGGFSDAEMNKTSHYEEEKRTLRSTSRGEGSTLSHRHRQEPKENTVMPPVQPKSNFSFSDDDEEKRTPFQQKTGDFQSRHGGGDKMNHYSARNIEQKGKAVRKPPTTSFIHLAGTCMTFLVPALLALLLGMAAVFYISPESVLEVLNRGKFLLGPQVKKDLKGDFKNLTSVFTNQSPLMWSRSRRILELHLDKWKNNAEPAIILLAGAQDAEQTLLCLGTQLADIYSSSLNGNYTVISGSDWASGSNEEVKEYIDHNLSTGFQATTRAAVLHHIERLPAGSLLILYKYCDHETAVFKNVMLLLTVLLDDATLKKDMSLPDLEEKVRAFLIQKLIDSKTKLSHDGMDEDKFSGIWSRISHVVLPVFPEKNTMEQCSKKQK